MNKSLNKILPLPPFNAERQLKSTLANSMYSDANDFNWRASLLLNNIPHETKSYFGKIYVDLLMSVESSLKSLIISLSPKSISPEDAYINARSKSHNISDLYSEVQVLAKRKVRLLNKKELKILTDAKKNLGVSNRYNLITFLLHQQEDSIKRMLHMDNVSSILNEQFLRDFLKVAIILCKISKKSANKYFGLQGMSGTNWGKLQDRTKLFYTTLKANRKL